MVMTKVQNKSGVRISALEIENLKRVRAVSLDCSGTALTVIGGRNGQGKTSILDAIMWALGGDRFKPSRPLRDGAEELKTALATVHPDILPQHYEAIKVALAKKEVF
jgi:recombinational DNA repair ATPase RecF